MPAWPELHENFLAVDEADRVQWAFDQVHLYLQSIGRIRGGRNVIFYGSAFLQKPAASSHLLSIVPEEINHFMSLLHGMQWDKGLTLVLHTPGGSVMGTQTLVEYLRSKFDYIEVIVPTYAMSAGTMICLASNRIVMGRQSQLGPVDPQLFIASESRTISAKAVIELFDKAKQEILADRAAAHVWAPILRSLGPSLYQEAEDSMTHSKSIVERWASSWMFGDSGGRKAKNIAKKVAQHFGHNAKAHDHRIDREEARAVGLVVEDLEDNQELQECTLSAYHLSSLVFDSTNLAKLFVSDAGLTVIKATS